VHSSLVDQKLPMYLTVFAVTGTSSTAVTATPAKAPTMKSAQMPLAAPLKVKNAFLVSMFGHALLSF
jgi:hypothetical protein